MNPEPNLPPAPVGNDADDGDLFFLIAAGTFLSSLHVKTSALTSASENDLKKQLDLVLRTFRQPNVAKTIEDAARLLCATHSKQLASYDYLATCAGYDKNKRAFERALKNNDAVAARKAFQKRALILLQFKEFRELNTPLIKRLLIRACETNDTWFFKQLGRRLSEKPKSISETLPEIIRILLLTFWDNPHFGQPLCRLTDEALTKFCEIALQSSKRSKCGVSFDQVQKIRQRLKLKKGPEPHFKNVRLDGERMAFS